MRPSVIKRMECVHGHPAWTLSWCPEGHRAGVERVYWAADEVLEALSRHYIENTVCSDFKLGIGVLERWFSGEGAS